MELTQYYCQTCGGILKSIGENSLKCTFCGNIYEKDSFQEKARTLRDILDQSKIEHVSNQRRNLYNAICAKYISKAEVQRYATEIKMYLPNDFQANFYLDAISGDAKKINELIRGIDTDECYELLSPIIRFLTASLESEFVLELGNLIERAYQRRDPELYSRLFTAMSKEAEKVSEGIYEASLPRDVFIAYSSKDMPTVSRLCEDLEDQGFSCFVAARNLRHGVGSVENYDEALKEAMDNCTCFLFLSSTNSRKFDCDAVRKEIPYVKQSDNRNAPAEFRHNYKTMPAKYKKPRIEYRLGTIKRSATDKITNEFFDGYEWVYDSDGVAERLVQILSEAPQEGCDHAVVVDPAVEPTCTTDGRTEGAHCALCGEILRQPAVIPAKGHRFGELKMKKQPTCTEGGEYERVCDCGERETILFPSLGGHRPGEWIILKPATHESEGLKIRKCAVCGETVSEEKIPSEGHRFGQWTVTKKQTCVEDGVQERSCSCGKKETITFPAHGVHQPGEWKTVKEAAPGTDGRRIKACVSCGKVLAEEKIPALSAARPTVCHHVAVIDPAVAPTCTSAGRTEGSHCSLCGEVLKRPTDIPALGHKPGAWRTTKAATATEAGLKVKACTVCGEKLAQESIPKLAPKATASSSDRCPQCGGDRWQTVNGVKTCAYCGNSPGKEKAPKASANAGELYDLGHKYYFGNGVKQDYKKAAGYFSEAANQGHVYAQNYLGECYYYALGVKQDYGKAFDLYTKSANQGYARAQYNLGLCYNYGNGTAQDYGKAYEWYAKGAAQGNSAAQCYLGECYYFALGVKQDYGKAYEWYTKSANQGYARAQNNLGECHYYGRGVTQNYGKAYEWYTKSANQGYARAQNNLGECYYYGRGVAKDYSKALEWYEKAAAKGDATAQFNVGLCYNFGYGTAQDYGKAYEWYTKSANQGYARAQNNLGDCYYYGRGVDQNYAKAFEWYTKSANQGYTRAQNNLGECYYYGRGVAKNYAKAAAWYTKAAEQGNATAQFNVGLCYNFGYGTAQDYGKACEWYAKAADQDHTSAQYYLAYSYEHGRGVTKNKAKALELYRKAAAKGNETAKKALDRLK